MLFSWAQVWGAIVTQLLPPRPFFVHVAMRRHQGKRIQIHYPGSLQQCNSWELRIFGKTSRIVFPNDK
jgi:hypothetical protein